MNRSQSIAGKIWPRRLHNKIIWGVVVVQTLLLGFFAVDIIKQQKQITLNQNKEQAKSLAQALAVNARFYIISHDEDMLLKTLQSINEFPELDYAAILEDDGKVLAHTNPAYLGMKLADSIGSKGNKDSDGSIIVENSKVADVTIPIYDENGSKLIGWAKLALNRSSISNDFRSIVKDVILYMLLGLLVSVIIAYFIAKNLSKELNILFGITEKIADGHVKERAASFKNIEIERLGKSFNRMLDEISAKQQLLDTIMQNIPVGIWLVDDKGKIVSGNPEALRIWRGAKYAGADNYGEYKAWNLLTGKQLGPEDWASVKMMQTGKAVLTQELEIECFDKSHKTIINSAVPFLDEGGKVKGGIVINLDITAIRKREDELEFAQKQVNLTEATFRAVFNYSSVGKAIVSLDGKILQANKEYARVTGYSEDELMGMAIEAISDSLEMTNEYELINKIRAGEIDSFKNVRRILRKDKEYTWVHLVVTVVRDGKGKPLFYISNIEDISAEMAAESKLRESEGKFKWLIDNMNVGVIQHASDTSIQLYNKAALKMLGVSADQLTGVTSFDPLWNVIHEDGSDFPADTHPVSVAITTGEPVESVVMGVYRPRTKDRIWLSVNAFPYYTSNYKLNHVVVTFVDITQRKITERENEKLNRLYKFIGSINELILRDTTRDEILRQACETAVSHGGFRMAWVAMYNAGSAKVKPYAWAGYEDGYLTDITITADEEATGRGVTGRAIKYKTFQYCDDIANDPDMLPWREEALKRGYRSSISLPIMVNGRLEAIYTMYMNEPFFFGNQEEIELLLKVTNDISFALDKIRLSELQMKVEKDLEQSEELNRAILNTFPDRIFRLKENGTIVEVQADKRQGLSPENKIAGKKITDVVTSKDTADKLMIALHKAFVTGKLVNIEYDIDEHGIKFHFEGRMIAIPNGEVLFIARDITDAKNANIALEKKIKEVSDLRYALDEGTIVDISDHNGVIIHVNDNFSTISKYSREELIGQNHRLLNSGHHPSSFFKKLWTTVLAGNTWRGEVKEKAGDGTYFWLDTTIVPFLNQKGKPHQFISIRKDITDRKNAEEELIRSNAMIKERVKELNLLYRSSEIANRTEGSIEQVILKIISLIPSGYQYPDITMARIIFEGKEYTTELFSESDWKQSTEIVLHEKSLGKIEIFYAEEKPIEDEGPFLKEERMLINTIADILANTAERNRIADSLQESEAKFRSLVEGINAGVFIDQEGSFKYTNPAFEQILGYTKEEFLTEITPKHIIHPDDIVKVQEAISQKKSGKKESTHYNLRMIRKDGTTVHIEVISSSFFYQGKYASIGTIMDITEKMEEEKRINRAVNDAQEKERLQIGMELHDNVKQIMAASLMSLGFAKDSMEVNPVVAAETIDNVRDYIREAIQELRRLSHQLAPSADTNLPLAEKIRMLADNMNSAKSLDIHINVEDFDEPLHNDIQLAFYRVLQEQLSNILKYAKATIAEILIEKDNKGVKLTIRDNGKGFDTSVKKDGIGLENIKRRVSVLGGEAKIISSPGKGCSVILTVPFMQ